MSLAKYTFLPWLRRGIANQLTASATQARAQIEVGLTVNNAPANVITKTVSLVGPGDVIGFNQRMIVRTEPRNLITDFEPNYLSFVEFYDEDFPWRYTPEIPQNKRLTPWVSLVVLKETEFKDLNMGNRPLPVIQIKADRNDILPPPAEAWAWAHTHLNATINAAAATKVPDLVQLNDLLKQSPDRGVSRLVCPRHLEANTAYHAFLIPTFEIGRMAGLGNPVLDTDSALTLAWAANETGEKEFPVYFRWFFRTGAGGDFETLVRLLQPRDMDKRVGIRDMDVQVPEFGMGRVLVSPNNTVGLEGALMAPTTERSPKNRFDDVSDFPEKIQPILNLPAEIRAANLVTDPVVTPPLYGQWHALIEKLALEADQQNWFHELNQDPRYRVPAGMGSLVVQKNQENYVKKAWEQVGDVISANQKIRLSQLSMLTSLQLHRKHLTNLEEETSLSVVGSMSKKVITDGTTAYFAVQQSLIPVAALSPAFRKLLRPRGMMAKRVFAKEGEKTTWATLNNVTFQQSLLKKMPAAKFSLPAEITKLLDFKKDAVRKIDARSHFDLIAVRQKPQRNTTRANAEVPIATDFRKALEDFHGLLRERVVPPPPRNPLAIANTAQQMIAALNPLISFPLRVLPTIKKGVESLHKIEPIMAYPDIKEAMYEPLVALNKDFFVPNLNLILPNTISLMLTNQPFIEAYMVGLNHEMMRELLWREYPTDQRGTPFRQFWKPVGDVQTAALSPKQQAEKGKDIPPIHTWLANKPKDIHLGQHNHRPTVAEDGLLVLVIKGDLLKRYPNTIIYAQKAKWNDDPNSVKLEVTDPTGQQTDGAHLKHPIYRAQIDPDLHFIGFDLRISEAKGNVKEENAAEKQRLGNNDLGWFFVIQEVPGEPRFGLDETTSTNPSPQKWDNLSWQNLGNEKEMIVLNKPLVNTPTGTNSDEVNWNSNSADLAYILFQKPVMVAVHAREMLNNLFKS